MKSICCVVVSVVGLFSLAGSEASASVDSAHVMKPVGIEHVEVGGEIGRRIDVTIANNVLAIDVDKDFLKPFADKGRQGGYIGLGKFIDSLVRFAAYSQDARVLELKEHVVAETIAGQEQDGYIGICRPDARMWRLWDIHEMGYIVLGLTADHAFFGREASLRAAERLAGYIIDTWSAQPERETDGWVSVNVGTTGLEEALLALGRQTGSERYRAFCVEHRKLAEWDTPLIEGRWGNLEGHAYYHLCRSLAQLRLYGMRPDARLLDQSRRVFDFLLCGDGLLIPGLCGYHECWHSSQQGFFKLGETCATAYLIRWLDEMLRIEGASVYGDVMERSILNGLFAAQSPDGRKLRYYSPMEGKREYFSGDTYCCPCNFRRIIAELPGMIYYRRGDGAAVNLYTKSSARMDLADGVRLDIEQETDYPNSGDVEIRVQPSRAARFSMYLRIPRWCGQARVTVNDGAVAMDAEPGRFFAIERRWQAGDTISLQMPMTFRAVKGRKAQAGRAAVMRGPMVFCLNPERQGGLDAETMKLLRMDPASLRLGAVEEAIRPDGTTCEARFWKATDYNAAGRASLSLTLTEYADPGCERTYFLVPNPGADVLMDDELAGCEYAR